MDWMSVTNLNAYIKGLKQKTTWDLKQQKGDVTAKGTSLEDWLDSSQSKIGNKETETPGEHRDEKLANIYAKIDVGGKLTQKERDYLREKDPQAYQDLLEEERAQKAYEQALRRCKTKEDIRRLQTNSIHRSLMVVQSIEHNPHISQQKKLEIAMWEKRMTDSVRKSTQEFVRRGEFAQLPTQEEVTDARREQMDSFLPSKPSSEFPAASLSNPSEHPIESETAQTDGTHSQTEKENPMESQTLRKVRRAYAKSAYHSSRAEQALSEISFSPQWEKKA